jgi:hypothetical protein
MLLGMVGRTAGSDVAKLCRESGSRTGSQPRLHKLEEKIETKIAADWRGGKEGQLKEYAQKDAV